MFRAWLTFVVASALALAWSPAAKAAPPPVEAYGKLPGVEQVDLSPSGQRVAMIGVVGEQRKLLVGAVGGAGILAINIGRTKVRSVDWAGEDHVLLTVSQTASMGAEFSVSHAELSGVLVVSISGGKIFPVFDKQIKIANIVEGRFGARQIGGHWYGFFGGVTVSDTFSRDSDLDHTYPDLYRVDLDSGDTQRVADGSDIIRSWLVGPDGRVMARSTYNQERATWEVLAGSSGGRLLASGQYPYGGASLSRGRTADTVLIERPSDKGGVEEEIPLAGGAAVEGPDSDITAGRYHDRATGLWIGYSTRGDEPGITMFDPLANHRVAGARKAFPGKSTVLESWSNDFSRMVVFTSGGDDSGTYWIVDVTTGKAQPIGYQYPTVQSDDIGPIRMIQWKAADGTVIHGVLSLPPGREAKNLPVVVLPHGGPAARDYPVFDWWAQAFASRGYAVLQPNFRGSTGYGVEFRNAGFGEWGRKMQTDVSDGLAELGRQGIVDPKRACIVGASYGGYAALAGVTVQQGLYRCAVAVAGVADPARMITQAREERGAWNSEERYWRDFLGPSSGYDQISPVKLAARADAPILLIHGKDDTVVPFGESEAMQRALTAAHKPVEMVTMPSEDHWLSREDTRTLMLKSSVAFVEKHNPPDAAK